MMGRGEFSRRNMDARRSRKAQALRSELAEQVKFYSQAEINRLYPGGVKADCPNAASRPPEGHDDKN